MTIIGMKRISIDIALMRDIKPSRMRKTVRTIVPARNGSSFFTTEKSTFIGLTIAATPKISRTFVMFEPYALPSAMSGLPSKAETAETSISGADVPNPTMIMPMRNGETPKILARPHEPSTNLSALHARTKSETMRTTP